MLSKLIPLVVVAPLVLRAMTPPAKVDTNFDRLRNQSMVYRLIITVGAQAMRMIYVCAMALYIICLMEENARTMGSTKRGWLVCDPRTLHTPYSIWTSLDLVAYSMLFVGSGLRIWSYKALGRTYHLSVRQGHELITTGPYATLMHPSYTGGILANIGFILFFFYGRLWSCIFARLGLGIEAETAFIVGLHVFQFYFINKRVRAEEAMLQQQFKGQFDEYKNTRARFIPFVW
ncbi:hypothetical protein BZG36_01065 [Bifiguratus adelaidae]|uniref:Protein-S-isoprenylcysteine O-methyltransferase n=1 Tax=Bifiguratus adelaidae TaxID=1938954 RepID=A0A261Y649_9FUNG|nr:hypothetical protein BZG36_01065 [Bifiguratus adelaidae]